MKIAFIFLVLIIISCSKKKTDEMPAKEMEVKTEVAVPDSTAKAIDKELDEVDNLLKEIE